MIKILVPVAFTEKSENALSYALTLAGKFPSRVVVVYCFSAYLALSDYEKDTLLSQKAIEPSSSLKEQEQKARQQLNRLCEATTAGMTESQRENVTVEGLFELGYPEDVIPEMGARLAVDVIVMGTQSKGETIKELLGSVTNDVITRAKCPVLAVPVNSSVDLNTLTKVLFLTDFGDDDYISLHKLIRLITPFNTQIHAVHFCHRDPDKAELRRMQRFHDYCEATYRNHELIFRFSQGSDFVSAVGEYVSNNQIEMVSMTRRRRNMISKFFSPSMTRKTLFSTDIPLLVFHV